MALGTLALHQLEARLPKVISPEVHGVLDYCYVAFFAAMAVVVWKKNRRAAFTAAGTSAFLLTEALLTDYKYGVTKVIPFSAHGRLDSGFTAASLAIPKVFGFEGTGAATVYKANAFLSAAAVGLTDWSNERARAEK